MTEQRDLDMAAGSIGGEGEGSMGAAEACQRVVFWNWSRAGVGPWEGRSAGRDAYEVAKVRRNSEEGFQLGFANFSPIWTRENSNILSPQPLKWFI